MEKGYSFFISFLTNGDFLQLKDYLIESDLKLGLHCSGYNSKYVISSFYNEDEIDWNMDSSNTHEFVATGHIYYSVTDSIDFLNKLSDLLLKAEIKHEILMDFDNGEKTFKISN